MQKLQPKDSKIFCRGARAAITPFFKKAAEALWANHALLWVCCREGKGTQEPWLGEPRGAAPPGMRCSTFHPGRDAHTAQHWGCPKKSPQLQELKISLTCRNLIHSRKVWALSKWYTGNDSLESMTQMLPTNPAGATGRTESKRKFFCVSWGVKFLTGNEHKFKSLCSKITQVSKDYHGCN